MNQVIRIVFDDDVSKSVADRFAETIIRNLGDIASIEVYEEEFEEDENGQEQRTRIE